MVLFNSICFQLGLTGSNGRSVQVPVDKEAELELDNVTVKHIQRDIMELVLDCGVKEVFADSVPAKVS